MSIKKTSRKQSNSKTNISGKLTQLIKQYEGKTISGQIEKNLQNLNITTFDMKKTPVIDLFDCHYFNEEIDEKQAQIFPVFLFMNEGKPMVFSGWHEYIKEKRKNSPTFQGYLLKNVTEEQAILYFLEFAKNEADNPLIQAFAYKKLKEKLQISYSELSKMINISKSQIINYVKLLSLPQNIKNSILNHELPYSLARSLNGLKTSQEKEEIFKKIKEENLSAHEVEELIRKYKSPEKNKLLNIGIEQNKVVIRCNSKEQAEKIMEKIRKMHLNS